MTLPLTLLEQVDAPLWVASPATGGVLWANARARALFGWEAGEDGPATGHARALSGEIAARLSARRGGEGAAFDMAWPVPEGGGLAELPVRCQPLPGDAGDGMLVSLRGREGEATGGLAALEGSGAMVSLFRRQDGAALYANRAARERQGGADTPLAARFRDAADLDALLARLDADGTASLVARVNPADGPAERWHRIEARTGRDAGTGARTVELVEIDATETVSAMRALEEARDAAVRSDRAKSDFLAKMSHEIRTQLTGVIGVSILLWNRLDAGREKELAGNLVEAGKTLEHIANEILELSRIEAGHLQLEETEFRPFDLVEAIVSGHELSARERGIGFEVVAGEGANLPRLGDTHRLMQIVANLVSNAIRFTVEGAVRVHMHCAEGAPLRIEVADTGIGMSEDEVARVFDRYAQAHGGTAREYGGSGLGLHIVKDLVTAMRGTIEVTSEKGAGTTMRVELPLPMARPPAARKGAQAACRGLRVLALEDNSTDIAVFERQLETLGMEVTAVGSAEEAVAQLAEGCFDLVMIDTDMPGLDAPALLGALEEAAEACPARPLFLAITPHDLPRTARANAEAGFDATLAKPFRIEELAACLDGALTSGSRSHPVGRSRQPARTGRA